MNLLYEKRRTPGLGCGASMKLAFILCYQILTLSSGARYMGSPSLMPKAL